MQRKKNQKKPKGLKLVNGIWKIDKTIGGRRFYRSCETDSLEEAELCLAAFVEEQRNARLFGVRPDRCFGNAAARYLEEFSYKRSIFSDANDLKMLMPFVGQLSLADINNGSIKPYIESRRQDGVKSGTVNRSIRVLNRILRLCADEWIDENGLSWLDRAMTIRQVKWNDQRKPRPISWEEQGMLFKRLPEHLRDALLYKVNTGCREQEVCQLKWAWEVPITELATSVFVLPDWLTKNARERIVVLNSVALEVINRQRGKHPENVFTYKCNPLAGLNEGAFKRHRKAAGLEGVRIHDLRHTTGRRLRAAGVSNEARKDILGHESGDMTSHYSIAEIKELVDAVELIAQESTCSTLTLNILKG